MKQLFILFALLFTLLQILHAQPVPQDTSDIVWEVLSPSPVKTIIFSNDNTKIITGHDDKTIRIWDVNDGSIIKEFGIGHLPALSPDGTLLAAAGNTGDINIWNTQNWEQIKTLKGINTDIFSLDFSNDNRFLSVASDDNGLIIYSMETDDIINRIDSFPFIYDIKSGKIKPEANGVDYLPNSNKLAFSGDWTFIYDLGIDSILFQIEGRYPKVSSDGKKVLTMQWSPMALFYYDIETGIKLKTIQMGTEHFDYTFSPDGKFIVTASEGGLGLKIWDLSATPVSIHYRYGPYSTLKNVAVSSDGNYIATYNGNLLLYNARFGPIGVEEQKIIKFSIKNYYPNPTKNILRVEFVTEKIGKVKLILLNETGLTNKILINKNFNSGDHEAVFDLSLIPSGISFLKLEQDGKVDIKKIVIVK